MTVARTLRTCLAVLLFCLATPLLLAAGKPRNDFNGDGTSDLLWRNSSTGKVYVMPMSGGLVQPGAVVWTETNPAWQIVGTGDFDLDGKADILWRNSNTGQVFLMLMNGTRVKSSSLIYTEPNTAWTIQAVADFNGDTNADILWRNDTTGQVYLMPMNGTTVQSGAVIWTEPNPAWQIVGTGDFDGDGKADILWWNSSTGQVFQMLMDGTKVRSFGLIYTEPNTTWRIQAIADFSGEGMADILWRNSITGQVYLMVMNNSAIQARGSIWEESNPAWQIVNVGDFDGDGKADIVWWNSSTGQVFQMLMNGMSVKSSGIIHTEPDTEWNIQNAGARSIAPLTAPIVSYVGNKFTFLYGKAIQPLVPFNSGGIASTWVVNPVLPPGLNINPINGTIFGTPNDISTSSDYIVTALNNVGNFSLVLSISVAPPAPTIDAQPANQVINQGATAIFKVSAWGTGNLGYQWFKNGNAITGATSTRYIIMPVLLANNGDRFSVLVNDDYGNITHSKEVTLTVVLGAFTNTGSMGTARWPSATLLPNGKGLFSGGSLASGQPSGISELYDPTTGFFSPSAPLKTGRSGHTATVLPNGKVIIAGGTSTSALTVSAELYDSKINIITATGPMVTPRVNATATLLPTGKVLATGGVVDSLGNRSASAELYDPAIGASIATGSMQDGRADHTATRLANGKILIVGGYSNSTYVPKGELYDPTTGSFTTTGALGTPRVCHTATLLPNGKVLVAGGTTNSYPVLASELYDPTTGIFTTTGSLGCARVWHTATLLPNGKVLMAGGQDSGWSANALSSSEIYDPLTGRFAPSGPMITSRAHPTAILLGTGEVLMAGGWDSSGIHASAELYNAEDPAPGFPSIAYASAAYQLPIGSPITAITPLSSGATTWSISPALPAGLSFYTSTGAITGTPLAAYSGPAFTVTASNGTNSTSAFLWLSVTP